MWFMFFCLDTKEPKNQGWTNIFAKTAVGFSTRLPPKYDGGQERKKLAPVTTGLQTVFLFKRNTNFIS